MWTSIARIRGYLQSRGLSRQRLISAKKLMGASNINLSGAFINHKTFGKGQIIEQGADFVTVQFVEEDDIKKFIFPAAMESFLVLEDAGIAEQYKEYSAELANNLAEEQKAAIERLALEQKAAEEYAKALKKSTKKTVKKTKSTT